jgi:hypothetical protein
LVGNASGIQWAAPATDGVKPPSWANIWGRSYIQPQANDM